MNLIGKDRQLEALVEKLCHRLRGASDERHCTDLSYCLTLVPYTDRTIQKLVDNIACFADKLNYAKLHKHFTTIVITCKKQTKMNKVSSGFEKSTLVPSILAMLIFFVHKIDG